MVTSNSTPRFLRSTSPKGLERAMLENNIKRRSWHNYTIIFDGKNWFAWYYVDLNLSTTKETEEILSKTGE